MVIKRLQRPFSLATRLTFFISLATIASFFAFAWIMIHSVKVHFAEQDINDLKEISTTLERILNHPDEPEFRRLETLKNVVAGYSNVIISLEDANQKAIFHSPGAPDLRQFIASAKPDKNAHSNNVFLLSGPMLHSQEHAHGQKMSSNWRMIRLPIGQLPDGKAAYTLYMALSIDFHLHYINDLKNKLIMTASLISMMIIFIVLFAVYKGHAPIRNVSRRIQNITSKDLDVRLDPQAVPIELEQLVASFNHMIERIEDVFKRQSNFSADIAHEIRTPITNLVTQTEIALSQPRSQKELEDVLYSNLEEFGRMSKMVSDMLFLAQADNNQLIPEKTALNLADEVSKVFDFFEAWAEEREVSLRFEGRACWVSGDPLMLRRAMSNLISNAIRYTPKGESVTVRVKEADGQVQIIVENPGPPIAAEHLPRLFDRFYRVDPSRQRKGEGSGIGLAIVKSIVTAHQGKVSVTSDPRATRFILTLPKHAI
ncbi:Cu(+)/Ag(+) sensor histidine kinase [Citrobacter werkmanii]|uniref:Cu(+)/Ag(+) sensor histidine kinase n=1 Tax=Citrobacter sp. Cm046 TaxID=2985118 RepID=UPI00190243E9|nr:MULTISPECIES: Cu(+)/Ag(+) sensor histidine kinase [Citrobacter]MBJ9596774.1 Cu(+)/Ag(+) sensor histidine kinase [Citrobacter werkmanii]MBJ9871893.1 Cu(+)/Ag(+) sensor histidine kinase [Citrobacter werkmanii]MDM2928818.1 Cu(+)/Ag(+) sensor histidine kinase [Citrobacter sp. Cm046]HEB0852879.1 Cu(+)/Ag(+) sensor histidine kinase [Citrobacter freundii]